MKRWMLRRLSALLIACLLTGALPVLAEDAAPEAPEAPVAEIAPGEADAPEPETQIVEEDDEDFGLIFEEDPDSGLIFEEDPDPEADGALEAGEDTGLTIDDGAQDEQAPQAPQASQASQATQDPDLQAQDEAGEDTGLTIDDGAQDAPADAGDRRAALYANEQYGDTRLMAEASVQVGYALVAARTVVYQNADLTAELGRFMLDGAVFVEASERDGSVLRVRFDTQEARDWAMEVPTGYVLAGDVLSLTDEEETALAARLESDARTRSAGDRLMPCAEFDATSYAFQAAGTVTELGVASHTPGQIQAFVDAHPAYRYQINIYSAADTDAPYASGRLSAVNQRSALNMVNQVRYIAGIDANLKLLSAREEMMADAALVLRLNGKLSHYPARPAALAGSAYDALYQLGYTGAGSANIAMGYTATSAILAYMADSDAGNIATVGHRRWILNPGMGGTVFGASDRFSAMYAHDMSGTGKQTKVAWPAQEMPLQYFSVNDPWSLSYGRVLDAKKMQVDVTRASDGKSWHFDADGSDGYFNVENSYYGRAGCVIFRPSGLGALNAGERFNVSVTDGASGEITRYTVRFFDLNLNSCQPLGNASASATWQNDGVHLSWNAVSGAAGYYVCRRDGDANYQIVADVKGVGWVDGSVTKGTGYTYQVYAHTASITSRSSAGVQPKVLIPESVALDRSGKYTLYTNEKLQLTVSVTPENARTKLTWKSTNAKVAKVSADGLVTPVKKGTAYISVTTDNGKSATLKVKVAKPPKPTKVKLNKKGTVKLSLYDTLQLTATLKPAHAASKLTWKSSNKKVAKVNSKGVVTPKKKGKATITVRTKNGKTAKVKIKVYDPYEPKKVALDHTGTITLKVGETLKLGAILTPDNARTKLTWKSSKKKVAKVSADGTVTARKKGKATITVRTKNGKTAKVKIKVVK